MFDPISIPFGAKMLFNTVKLKPGVSIEDVELAIGEMCNVVQVRLRRRQGRFHRRAGLPSSPASFPTRGRSARWRPRTILRS